MQRARHGRAVLRLHEKYPLLRLGLRGDKRGADANSEYQRSSQPSPDVHKRVSLPSILADAAAAQPTSTARFFELSAAGVQRTHAGSDRRSEKRIGGQRD